MEKKSIIIILCFALFLLFSCRNQGVTKSYSVIALEDITAKKDPLQDVKMKKNSMMNKCDINIVRNTESNMDTITSEHILEFLYCFDKSCFSNVEFIEYSGEIMYILLDKHSKLTLEVLDKNRNICLCCIKKILENPISDNINIRSVYDKVYAVKGMEDLKKELLISINIAMEKI